MVARIHDTYYDAKATLLSDDAIKEIRESRGRIPNASKKMANKFHIGPKRVYEIWDNKERLQQGAIPSWSEVLPAITASENVVCDTETESSSSEVLEGSKVKKTGGKKIRSKPVQISLSTDQVQSIQTSKKDTNKEKLDTLYKKMVERSKKNIANAKNILEK
ncbi:hypothetical protein C2G38_2163090 [Gigaspora rosea]|uniref:Uncharacterized protein n=1 Tax=Gigaspora rosea TaxID=44941 RepID=A0A397VVF4_9GLOM|nr:hypothetical protein C2G38_2163090 [Gigaspora rosea]